MVTGGEVLLSWLSSSPRRTYQPSHLPRAVSRWHREHGSGPSCRNSLALAIALSFATPVPFPTLLKTEKLTHCLPSGARYQILWWPPHLNESTAIITITTLSQLLPPLTPPILATPVPSRTTATHPPAVCVPARPLFIADRLSRPHHPHHCRDLPPARCTAEGP